MIGLGTGDCSHRGLFPLGRVVATRNAAHAIDQSGILQALARHAGGDWGIVCAADWQANERALTHGERLVSVYLSESGVRFYVITEADRSLTTVLLPEEY